jgi:hypothetical protein
VLLLVRRASCSLPGRTADRHLITKNGCFRLAALHALRLTGSEVVWDARALLVLDHRRDRHTPSESSRTEARGTRESSQMHADRAELPLVGKEGDQRGCWGQERLHSTSS